MAEDVISIILLVLSMATTTTISSSSSNLSKCCPDFWIQVGNSCYKISPAPMSWFDAEQYCTLEGGHLIEIRREHEQVLLASFLQTGTDYWIGLTDLADEGTYVWQTDYTEASYTFWQKIGPQPDNANGNEDCVHLKGTNHFLWNDRNCEQSMASPTVSIHALCEIDMQI